MNAHQKYAHNLVNGPGALTAHDVAAMIALPPSRKNQSAHRIEDVHQVITDYGTDDTKRLWSELLAEAAGVKRESEWPADWAVGIFAMISTLPRVEVEAEVREMRAA